ncbi:hypothetical protein FDG94_gp054 [Pseudomonas phage SM1]|uniref:Uncharacterized protein n=2 Tax=Samunavirus TaxID=2560221 RepID=A0A0U3DWS2_9CAUD|nr:hypothetical protein FDG94_gp054 [Pseudomonas phage SM1]ALT58046.1 hypothetical protein SM1_054 [Pseudomonas phage SM1]UVN14095.1 hypothetical protein FBPa45_0093 [Pseudomonas phage vB_PaeS_FBPa45]WDS62517.1 tail tip protein [Pseudomonas phage UF_RH6]
MTDRTEDGRRPVARRNLRRVRGGARFASNSGSSNLRTPRDFDEQEHDDVDDAIDPLAVHRGVVSRARADDAEPGTDVSPAQRMFDVQRNAPASVSREYRLNLVGRLLMRKIPLDRIAQQLNVSVSTVEKDRAAWKKMLAERARQFDVNEYIGIQSEFYDEVSGQAMQIASMAAGENAVPTAMRLAAMRTALAGQADKTRTLQSAGVFEAARFRRTTDGSAMSDVQMLMARTMEALEDLMQADEPPPPPPRGGPPTTRRRDGSGFDDLTLDDPEEGEVMEL